MRRLTGFALALAILLHGAAAAAFMESPILAERVAAGALPPVAQRLPEKPMVTSLPAGTENGRYGGTLDTLMGRSKDTRMMVVYGYARLVGYNTEWNLVPDILESVETAEDRIFTLHLRKGHKWSDGHPFTAEDFRYYWEDVINNEELSPLGVPSFLKVDAHPPTFEMIDAHTVRYTWPVPNPFFLPILAGARPEYIYRPAHYLKQFHTDHADADQLAKRIEAEGQRDWVALHFRKGHQYKNDNPELPTLQPWILTTRPPSNRFVFERNPFYHRVDPDGRQLPYIDRVTFNVASSKLIPAKAAAGETHLQARGLGFENVAVLKEGSKRNPFDVRLWQSARGAEMALYPNLNVRDKGWRAVLREADFRRALSLAIDRDEINQVIYFGIAEPGNNTVLPRSPLFDPMLRDRWADFDISQANTLLDGLGLTARDDRGVRLLPDGRPMEITVETAGEEPTQVDILQLITESWAKIGIKLHAKPLQREVFRNRIFAGSTVMSVWYGLENAVPTAAFAPRELAPTSQQHLMWPKWGQYFETAGLAGEAIDIPLAEELIQLDREWRTADEDRRHAIWKRMLEIHADQQFSIGIVRGVPQPVVIHKNLRNVPKQAIYNWEPGAHFGIHQPDTFWFDTAG